MAGDLVGVLKPETGKEVKPKRITSPTNTVVKEAARLKRKRHRYESRLFLTEGEDLLDASLERGILPRQVFVLEGEEKAVLGRPGEKGGRGTKAEAAAGVKVSDRDTGTEIYICTRSLMDKLSELGSGSRVIAVFEMLDREFPDDLEKTGISAPILYLKGIRDPGNVGTLVRSAAALGAGAVVLGPGSADPYSSKSLRATMGAVFQIPFFLSVSARALASWASGTGIKIICADVHEGIPVWETALTGGFVLVLGSEREGISSGLMEAAAQIVRIPQVGGTESINVAMAGTSILYEALRQRSVSAKQAPAGESARPRISMTEPAGATPGAPECSCEKTERPPGQETPGRT